MFVFYWYRGIENLELCIFGIIHFIYSQFCCEILKLYSNRYINWPCKNLKHMYNEKILYFHVSKYH